MCLAEGHNAVPSVRLKPTTLRLRVRATVVGLRCILMLTDTELILFAKMLFKPGRCDCCLFNRVDSVVAS